LHERKSGRGDVFSHAYIRQSRRNRGAGKRGFAGPKITYEAYHIAGLDRASQSRAEIVSRCCIAQIKRR
jgi:hypothetical protein